MTDKMLTVIIPMYNAKPWIQKCLSSLLVRPKDRKYLEILVINDGSTDGCEKIAEKTAKEHPDMFRIIHKENGGHGSAINTGVRESKGIYIKILDADDWMATEELEQFLEEVCGLTKEPDFILCAYQTYDVGTGKKVHISAGPGSGYVDMGKIMENWSRYRPVCTFHGIVYRSSFYRQHSGKLPEKVFYDDGYYSIVPASYAEHIYVSDRCMYIYRIGRKGQSVSEESRVRRMRDARRVMAAICATIGQQRTPNGQAYWQLRTISFLADYLVTCFLRCPDKKAGRREAARFMKQLKRKYPKLAHALRQKYCFLQCMGYLRVREDRFQKLLRAGTAFRIYADQERGRKEMK